MLQGFKDFIARGNAVELAVGVVIGAAFGAVVTAFVDALISPLIGAIFGQTDLSNVWTFDAQRGAAFSIGLILNALIQFLFTAAAVYFFIVLPLNAMAARRKRGQEDEPEAPAEDILLLQEIRDLLAARPDAGHRQRRRLRRRGRATRPRTATCRRRSRRLREHPRSRSDRPRAHPRSRSALRERGRRCLGRRPSAGRRGTRRVRSVSSCAAAGSYECRLLSANRCWSPG